MSDIKKDFLLQGERFEVIFNDIFGKNNENDEEDTEIALLLFDLAESSAKKDLTTNIDNLQKVFNVVQFQSEMMTEFIRATVGSIMNRIAEAQEADAETVAKLDEDLIPMLMFIHEKMIKLHDQMDFFFANFEAEDLKKGFSIARRSATEVSFNSINDKDKVIAFVRSLRSRVNSYLTTVDSMHEWLHGMLDVLDAELNKNGILENKN